jgi:hypothetical protein
VSSYSLEAIVGPRHVVAHLPAELVAMGAVPLAGDLVLVPVPLEMLGHLYSDEPVLDAVRDVLGPLVTGASAHGALAYLHAELFDDEGSEGALVWRDGAVVFESFQDPAHDVGPIDRGLDALGVPAGPADGRDAFERLGLDRHHTLEDWIADAGAHPI